MLLTAKTPKVRRSSRECSVNIRAANGRNDFCCTLGRNIEKLGVLGLKNV